MIFQFHFYLSLFHALHFMNILVCIFRSVRDLDALEVVQKIQVMGFSHRWLVHNQFVGLGNILEVVVHYFLIRGMANLSYRDGFPIVSALGVWLHIGQDLWWVMT